jgi:DUF1680 family protein
MSMQTPDDALYANWRRDAGVATTLTFIPYHLWANRDAGSMAVWVPIQR